MCNSNTNCARKKEEMILKLVNRAINQGSKVSTINMHRISRAVEVNFQRNELLKL